jgi:hypothetical protein
MDAMGVWKIAAGGSRFPDARPRSARTSVESVIEAVTARTAPISLVAAPDMIAPVR